MELKAVDAKYIKIFCTKSHISPVEKLTFCEFRRRILSNTHCRKSGN